jgi:pimeloyl-ACP methyl ester carboxylesterase
VVCLDFRGHGLSSAPQGSADYAVEVLAGDVAALMDVLEIGKASFVGCSFGGMVAQEFAVTWPERVTALVLSDTSPAYERPEYGEGFRERERRIAESEAVVARYGTAVLGKRLATSIADPFAAEALRKRYERLSTEGYLGAARARRERRDLTPLLRERLKMPVMLCWGDEDPVASARAVMSVELPEARVAMFRELGHGVPARAPQDFASVLVTFLDDADSGKPVGGSIEV